MPTYVFTTVRAGSYDSSLVIKEEFKMVAEIPMNGNMMRNFVLTMLTQWVGSDNTSAILAGGTVSITREKPYNFDFTRFYKKGD